MELLITSKKEDLGIEAYIEVSSQVDTISDITEAFKRFLVHCGYTQNQIANQFNEGVGL